jgi:hypothetical protein
MIEEVKRELSRSFPNDLVEKLIDTYLKIKEDYTVGNYRSTSTEAGRLSEIVLRIIQNSIEGRYTPLNQVLPVFHNEVFRLGNITGSNDTIRFHIPRIIEVIHDIRNKRDVGHPKAELNANYSDATLSLYASSWVLAELIRICYNCDMDEAQHIVDELMQVQIPVIQEFGGFLKILNPKMELRNKILHFALYKKDEGITIEEIMTWTNKQHRRDNVEKVLKQLENMEGHIHCQEGKYKITVTGISEIANKRLLKINN